MTRPGRFYFQLFFTLSVCAFLMVPMAFSVLAGVTENYFVGIKSGLTIRWVLEVWSLYAETIWRSLGVALACLAVTFVIGVPLAYALMRSKGRIARAVEELINLPVAIPGLATALGLILTFGHFRDFRASWLFILVGHALITLPFMVGPVLAVMLSSNLSTLEEAASSLGAGFRERFVDIVVPNALPGILAGSLMVVTLSLGEFNVTWMLHTPLTKTLPVGLADSYASMRLEIGSAYTLIFLVLIVPLLLAMQWVTHRAQTKVRL